MIESYLIRTAVPGDLAALDALYARSYPRLLKPDYPPSVLVTALPLISRANPKLLRTATFFVAEGQCGELLGADGSTPARTRNGAEIRHLVTDDRQTRRGIGRALITRIFETCRAAGILRMTCMSTFTAVPFYRALGFVELGPVEVSLAPGITFPAMQMERVSPI